MSTLSENTFSFEKFADQRDVSLKAKERKRKREDALLFLSNHLYSDVSLK